MDEKELVKQEIYQAITFFVERQQLVAKIMLDLGLDIELIGQCGALGWIAVEEDSSDFAGFERSLTSRILGEEEKRLINAVKMNSKHQLLQRGAWGENGEWEYCLHGRGCSLTHRQTGESIDWDCPNVAAFKIFFFEKHLDWQLQSLTIKNSLSRTQQWIDNVGRDSIDLLIDEMITDKIIRHDPASSGNYYILESFT